MIVKCPASIPKSETEKCVGNPVNYAPVYPLNDGPDAEVMTLSKFLSHCNSGCLSRWTVLKGSQGKVRKYEKLLKAPGVHEKVHTHASASSVLYCTFLSICEKLFFTKKEKSFS